MIKYYLTTLVVLGLAILKPVKAQNPSQTIKGTVIDKQAQSTLPGVNVIVLGSNPIKGTTTDVEGKFKLMEIFQM